MIYPPRDIIRLRSTTTVPRASKILRWGPQSDHLEYSPQTPFRTFATSVYTVVVALCSALRAWECVGSLAETRCAGDEASAIIDRI